MTNPNDANKSHWQGKRRQKSSLAVGTLFCLLTISKHEANQVSENRVTMGNNIQSSREQSKSLVEIDLENCSLSTNGYASRHMVTGLVVFTILLLGSGTAAALLAIGITSVIEDQEAQFSRSSLDLIRKIEGAWEDYVTAASWIHGRCRSRNFDRIEFREMYEYLVDSGLDFQAAQFDPNITHDERDGAEAEARYFYAESYPQVDYQGFVGFNFDNSTSLEPRLDADFYFPIRKF